MTRQHFRGESSGLNRSRPGRGGLGGGIQATIWLSKKWSRRGLRVAGRRLQGVVAGEETQCSRALDARVRAMFWEPHLALRVALVL